jgi:hypothetical protein
MDSAKICSFFYSEECSFLGKTIGADGFALFGARGDFVFILDF